MRFLSKQIKSPAASFSFKGQVTKHNSKMVFLNVSIISIFQTPWNGEKIVQGIKIEGLKKIIRFWREWVQ